MRTVLFVTWDGGGNVPPALAIAEELVGLGARVRFLGHEGQRTAIEGAGFAFESFRHAKPWSVLKPRNGPLAPLAYAAVFSDRGMGRDLVESLEREPADRVVIDGLLVGALDGASRAGIPVTILVHTLRDVMIRTLTSGPLALIMRLKRLDPARLYREAEAEIVVTLRSLDPAAAGSGESVRYTGPVLPEVEEARADATPPTILASLSTTYVQGQREVLQAILDAVADMDVRAIITTGPAVDPAELRAPANAELHRFVPHHELMPAASLVIGHGGHATTMLALAHGLPVLVIPMNPTFDQPVIGRILTQQGAGLSLPRSSGAAEIRSAIERLIGSTEHLAEARRLGAEVRAQRGAAVGASTLLPKKAAVD
jgi:UDP:flavonoid glycosyltransferase YjiC (YdhE family)